MNTAENSSLNLLEPVPEERLDGWLTEFYGHPVQIIKRQVLRHRDLSYVERIWIADCLPSSIIYKLVLPPWDVEKDILERVLIPSVTNSPQLYLAAHYGPLTALFMEDLGSQSILDSGNATHAATLGQDLAKMHRAYVYRVDDVMNTGVIRRITPIDYSATVDKMCQLLQAWHLVAEPAIIELKKLAGVLASLLAREPISLVHGDFYAENIILHNNKLSIIDWSWFTYIGVPLYDLATITSAHKKNGTFCNFRMGVIEAYCDESARQVSDVLVLLPALEALSRLLFLEWLIERKAKGLEGTTVGPVNNLIPLVVQESLDYNKNLGYCDV